MKILIYYLCKPELRPFQDVLETVDEAKMQSK